MGWEYDGDEDAFNRFVDRNSNDDTPNNDYSEEEYYVQSQFLDVFKWLYIANIRGGEKKVNEVSYLLEKRRQHKYHIDLIKEIGKLKREGSSYDVDKKELESIRVQLVEKFFSDWYKEYLNFIRKEEDFYYDIGLVIYREGPFKFEYFGRMFNNSKELPTALKVLFLAYTKNVKYDNPILPWRTPIGIVEKAIEDVLIKLHVENESLYENDRLICNFDDGSSFKVFNIYHPSYFECDDYYEYQEKVNEVYDTIEFDTDSYKTLIEIEYPDQEFADKYLKSLKDPIRLEINIPKELFHADRSAISQDLELEIEMNRSLSIIPSFKMDFKNDMEKYNFIKEQSGKFLDINS